MSTAITICADGSIHDAAGHYLGGAGADPKTPRPLAGLDHTGHGARLCTRRQVLDHARSCGARIPRGARIRLIGGHFGDRIV